MSGRDKLRSFLFLKRFVENGGKMEHAGPGCKAEAQLRAIASVESLECALDQAGNDLSSAIQ